VQPLLRQRRRHLAAVQGQVTSFINVRTYTYIHTYVFIDVVLFYNKDCNQ
jgi:hypothetical protein